MFRLARRRESYPLVRWRPLASSPSTWAHFLLAPSPLSLRVRSEGEGNGYRWRRSRRKGASQAPARSARPCSATASRSAAGAGAKTSPRPLSPAPALKARGADMTGRDPEIEELRDKVHCAVVLERTPPPWKLDRKESTKLSLKYRRGKGEILIVSHAGRGWWDPTSDAKGDVFGLVQRLEPGLASATSASACANSLDCRRASHQSTGQGAEITRTGPSPNAGPSERLFGPILRPGGISCESAGSPPRSSRLPRRPAFCGRGRLERLVRPSRWSRRCLPCRCARTDLQRFADRGSQIALPPAPERSTSSEAGSRRGGDRRAERRGHREPAQGHALYRDGRRHGPGHDRRARDAARQYRNAPRRASLQRCGRQWTGRPLRRPPPIACRKIQDLIRAASPSNRGGRLERRPARQIRNERSEAMTMLDATGMSPSRTPGSGRTASHPATPI